MRRQPTREELQDGSRFEIYVEYLFNTLGIKDVRRNIMFTVYQQRPKKRKGRAQVDLTYQSDRGLTLVECKHHKKWKVQEAEVQQIVDTRNLLEEDLAMLVTNSTLDRKARSRAQREKISVIDKPRLLALDQRAYGHCTWYSNSGTGLQERIEAIDLDHYQRDPIMERLVVK